MAFLKIILLKARSFSPILLYLFQLFLLKLIKKLNFVINYIFFLKQKINRITLLKSPHVYKKAREQFQLIKYTLLFSFFVLELKFKKFYFFLKLNTPKIIKIKFVLTNCTRAQVTKNSFSKEIFNFFTFTYQK